MTRRFCTASGDLPALNKMARPRGIPDEQLLATAQELLYQVGPAAFTLQKSLPRAGRRSGRWQRGMVRRPGRLPDGSA